MEHARDFHFTDRHFDNFRKMVVDHTGIALSDAKKELVYGRLTRRLRKLSLDSFDDYQNYILDNKEEELGNFINADTTNLTSFFREPHHFEYLTEEVIPELVRNNRSSRRIRVWSAGCSTGEEPYSLAITLREAIPDIDRWDVRILATDIDTNVIQKGENGIYDEERITGLSPTRIKRWFYSGRDKQAGKVRVKPELQEMISFRQLNLMTDWPMKGLFDILFCRNVVIYFDKPTQKVLFDRFTRHLITDAHLFIGHSETLYNVSDRFQLLGKTIYRRIR